MSEEGKCFQYLKAQEGDEVVCTEHACAASAFIVGKSYMVKFDGDGAYTL